MTKLSIDLKCRHAPYGQHLTQYINEGLQRDFRDKGKPHALHLRIPEGRHPRMVDFYAWRKIGLGSHISNALKAEDEDVYSALSVAAFDVGDSGGYLNAIVRDNLEWPTYYFMTNAVVAFENSCTSSGRHAAGWYDSLPEKMHIFTTGHSNHAILEAHKQIKAILPILFMPEAGLEPDFSFS